MNQTDWTAMSPRKWKLDSMHFPHIDLLRGLAAMLVLIYHMDVLGGLALPGDAMWAMPFRYGWMGVDLFLVISGFVITISAVKAKQHSTEAYRWTFMRRRFRRLLPLYAMTCLIFLFMVRPELMLWPLEKLVPLLLSHALFIQNLSHHTHGVINGVTWSLALEMQFYVLMIMSIGFWLRLGALRSGCVLVLIAWSWRYGTTIFLPPGVAMAHLQVIYTSQLPGTMDAFGVGIVLALWVSQSGVILPGPLRSTTRNFVLWSMIAILLLVPAFGVLQQQNYWGQTWMVVFWRTWLALGFGAAMAAVLTCPFPSGALIRVLHYMGQISYGIYLWHFLILLSLLKLTSMRGNALLWMVLTGTVALSSMSWHLMEKHWVRRSDV